MFYKDPLEEEIPFVASAGTRTSGLSGRRKQMLLGGTLLMVAVLIIAGCYVGVFGFVPSLVSGQPAIALEKANAGAVGESATSGDSVSSGDALSVAQGSGDSSASSQGAAGSSASSSGSAGSAAAASSTAQTSQSMVYVHVVGAVKHPGVYALAEGSRVEAAVSAAGGFSKKAATDAVNLAGKLSDGEQVVIPTKDVAAAASGGENAAPQPVSASTSSTSSKSSGKVDINHASATELQALPGVGEATAQKIIADRESQGLFSKPEDLKRVSGIGEKSLKPWPIWYARVRSTRAIDAASAGYPCGANGGAGFLGWCGSWASTAGWCIRGW